MNGSQIVNTIERLLIDASSGFFSDEERKALHVVIRITCEFRAFLNELREHDYPSFEVADYMIGTIRSGFDCFFDIFFASRSIADWPNRKLEWKLCEAFESFKNTYVSTFDSLTIEPISFQERLSSLLYLWNMHFVFLGLVMGNAQP